MCRNNFNKCCSTIQIIYTLSTLYLLTWQISFSALVAATPPTSVVATVITTVVVDNHMVVVANLDVWWKIPAIATNKNLGEASTL